jgi:hypothetical protein
MSEYVDLEELKHRVYFRAASLDPRFVWEKISDEDLDTMGIHDGFERFRLVDCAHRDADRIAGGRQCGHCGHENPYEPPAATAVRKKGRRK